VRYFSRQFWTTLKQRLPALSHWYTNHFPAINLRRKFDTWDYAFNFSSELLATGLVMLVVVSSIAVFGLGHDHEHDFSDNSLASRLLAYHNNLNASLYNKQNAIKTTVVKQDGLIASAQASDGTLTASSANSNSPTNTSSTIDEDSISAGSPDTVRDLITQQITVYTSQDGDTLGSIARKFNVSIDTIKWANHLPNNDMKPGWNLKILPTNGVLYQATSNDTWPDICKYFSAKDCDSVIAYNGKANAEDINAGDWIVISGGTIPAPKPAPGKKTAASVPQARIPAGSSHAFPKGYCTYYVASRRKITFGGNAKAWLANAEAAGYATGSAPAPGAVVVTTESRKYGHVAYVERVTATGIVVSEMNFEGFNKVDTRLIPFNSGVIRGYIY
jgi:N-acetylmuramoyl-L-alanine amidase